MDSLKIIELLNGQFRDFGIRVDQLKHDKQNRTFSVPIIAPDWDQTAQTGSWLMFRKERVTFVEWVLMIRQVESVTVHESERHNLREIELGSIQATADNTITIEGHYILRIDVCGQQLDLSLTKGDQNIRQEERWRVSVMPKRRLRRIYHIDT